MLDVKAFSSLCWALEACPISWMNARTPLKTGTFWKQTNNPLPPPSCLKKKKKGALVYKIASYTYYLQGVERAFFGGRYFKGKPVPACAVPCCVVGLVLCLCLFGWKPMQSFSRVWCLAKVWRWSQMLLLLLALVGSPIWSFAAFLRGSLACSSLLKVPSLGKGCLQPRFKENTMLVLPWFSQVLLKHLFIYLFTYFIPSCKMRGWRALKLQSPLLHFFWGNDF